MLSLVCFCFFVCVYGKQYFCRVLSCAVLTKISGDVALMSCPLRATGLTVQNSFVKQKGLVLVLAESWDNLAFFLALFMQALFVDQVAVLSCFQ